MSKVNIACALRWGVASVEITLPGIAYPIQEKNFRSGTCVSGRLSFGAARVKKADLCLYDYFCKNFGVN